MKYYVTRQDVVVNWSGIEGASDSEIVREFDTLEEAEDYVVSEAYLTSTDVYNMITCKNFIEYCAEQYDEVFDEYERKLARYVQN